MYLSTDGTGDLARHDTRFARFRPLDGADRGACLGLLAHPHRWYAG